MKQYPKDWDAVVDRFAAAIRTKLAMVAYKGDWKDVTIANLFNYGQGEMKELAGAIAMGNATEITLEAADVAICAMMISDIANGSPRPIATEALAKELVAMKRKLGELIGATETVMTASPNHMCMACDTTDFCTTTGRCAKIDAVRDTEGMDRK